MANELENVFIDYAKRVQQYLNELAPNVFIVHKEKVINFKQQDKVHVVVSYLVGTSNDNSVAIPVMLKIYSSAELADKVIGTFIALSKLKSNTSYTDLIEVEKGVFEEGTIYEKIDTPAVLNPDVQIGTNNHWVEYVGYCSILAVIRVVNIKSLKIDGETIKILNASLVYQADQKTNRVSGENLNKQRVKTASSSIKFNFVANDGVFSKKMIKMFFGGINKKEIFSADVEFADDLKFEDVGYVVSSIIYSANKQVPTLPSLEVILTMADTRA